MDSDMYEKGLQNRRDVLGADYVDGSIASATEFNKPLQDLVTEFCWGSVWGREGLTRKQRSMLNLGMLVALGRSHELRLHIRGALNNGVTKAEMSEIFLQTAVYCGFPAAIDAFRNAKQVFEEEGL